MTPTVKQTLFVSGIIHNNQQVLVVRRAENDHFLPGYLELPGGRVDLGETLEHALKRKLQQNLNILVDGGQFYMSVAEVNTHGPYVKAIFEVAHKETDKIKVSSSHSEFVWVDQTILSEEKITSDTKKVLEQYLVTTNVKDRAIGEAASLIIYTDGGSRGNPGPSASGFVIYDDRNTTIESGGAYIGITTNNQAEYTAVILALQVAKKHAGPKATINFNIDSLLVVNQMNGIYKIKNRDLWPLNQQIHELTKSFKQVNFNHVYREQNTAADAKVNEILDAHRTN